MKDKCNFKEVTRRKEANCSVCNELIKIKQKAFVVSINYDAMFGCAELSQVIGIIHIDCKEKFDFSEELFSKMF
jgi:hypothetical protein